MHCSFAHHKTPAQRTNVVCHIVSNFQKRSENAFVRSMPQSARLRVQHTHTHTHTHTRTHTHTHTHNRHTQTLTQQTHSDRERERERERETDTHSDTHRHTHRHTLRHIQTDRQTDTHTQTQTHTHTHTHTHTCFSLQKRQEFWHRSNLVPVVSVYGGGMGSANTRESERPMKRIVLCVYSLRVCARAHARAFCVYVCARAYV